jgi:GDPmannose 4,6-dehydratase
MKALIFGITGQDGFYLNSLLQKKRVEVIGVSRSDSNWIKADVADRDAVTKLVSHYRPDYIFHLAANSTTKHEAVFENHQAISTGTLNILESAYQYSKHTKIFLSGSGLQFVNKGKPISEKDEFHAGSPYCVSRIQSVYAARYYRGLGLPVYVGYFFNHDSPFRSGRHINQKIVMATKRIAGGSDEKIEIGDIAVKKEFSFAEDTAKAMMILIQNDNVYEATLGSGKAYSIEDWLNICFTYFGLPWEPYVTKVDGFRSEYDILVSNPETIFSLGWKPETSINQLAEIMITQLK